MGIFDLQLQTEVRPMETPVNQSTSTALTGLTNFVSSMGNYKSTMDQARDAEARARKASEPTYTEVKDQQEQANLARFTTGLADLAQMRDSGLSPVEYNMREKAFLTSFAAQGIDISSGAYDAAYTVTTGRPSNAMGLSETDVFFNQITATPEGRSRLALTNYSLSQTLNREPTREEVAAQYQADEAIKINFEQIKIKDAAELQQKLPQLEDQVTSLAQSFDTTLSFLRANDIEPTPEMMQNTYLNYKSAKMEVLAKLPANTPQDVKDNLFKLTDAFFVAQGMEKKDGVFVELSKDALQTKLSVQLTVKALLAKGDSASTLMANGLIARGYTIDPDKIDSYTAALSNLDLTPSTPAYITEAGFINSNSDMMSVAQALSSPDVVFSRDVNGITDTLKSMYTPEVYDSIQKETAAQAWSNLQAKSLFREGYNAKVILDGTADPTQVYNNLFGFASAIGTIDFTEEAVSFAGLRGAVSTSLPSMIDALEKVDPEKGSAIRKVTFYNIGKAAAEYDAQIKAEEKALNINFNPKSGSYELDVNAAVSGLPKEEADKRIAFLNLLKTKYNGDIVKAVADDFKATDYANLTEEEKLKFGRRGGRGAGQGYVTTDLIKDFTPDRAMRLLDLRNSRVYLDSVAGQIEPKDIKERRMNTPANIAGETMSTLAATEGTVTAGGITTSSIAPMSTTATLLDKFEGGGDYNALLGFANREGGPLAGTKVSEMTIGQLKNFADTTYSNYATKELGYKATPMGRYQFVGTTLADVASRMGLPDDTVFTPEVQDSMFTFHAKEVMAGKEQAGKRGALRSTWEGLKKATDAELDTMIAEIESGEASFATTGPTPGTKFQGVTPATRNVTPPIAVQAQGAGATATSTPTATPTQPMPEQAPTASPTLPETVQPEQGTQQGEAKTASNTPVDQKVLDTIKMLTANPNDVRVFATQDELIQAYNNQELRLGSLVVVNGEVKAVTQDMVGAK
jgi:hypothetical protein